jgi:hypothetical protein
MYKKVISKDIESKEDEPKLPEFKNSGDHAVFNKALRGLTENMKLMRPKAFQKILVIGCSDENYNKCNESCKDLKKEEKKADSGSRGPSSNHRNVLGMLEDIMAYENLSEDEYDKEAHEELYTDVAIWWDIAEQRIESKEDAKERAKIWRLIEKAIPEKLRKFFPKMTIGDIPYVLGRVLKLKAKSRGQEDAETHARFDKLKFTNSGNNKHDWAVMMAEYISLMEKFEKIADKPSEDRVMLHMYNDILLQDSRTRDLATHIKIANNSITADAMMDKVDALYRDI